MSAPSNRLAQDAVTSPWPELIEHDAEQPLSPAASFRERANILLARRIPVIPLLPRGKAPCTEHAAKDGSTDLKQVSAWAKLFSDGNCAAVAQYKGFWFLDDDAGTLTAQYKKDTGHDIPATFTVKTSRGYHYYFFHDEASRLIRYGGKENSGVISIPGYKGEARCNYQYVVGPGSVHPSGAIYEVVNDAPIVAAPVQLLEWLQKAYALSDSLKLKKEQKVVNANKKNDSGFRKMFEAVGYRPLLKRINALQDVSLHIDELQAGVCVPCPMPHHKHSDYTPCFGPLQSDSALLHCLGVCGWSGDVVKACYELDGGEATYKNMYECARTICKEESLNFEEFFPPKPVEVDEIVVEEPNENLLKRLHPKLSDDALYGLAGDIVKMIEPHTESHPAGLLVQILMYFGNIIGHTAYYQVESTPHYGNLFAVRVGVSSRARKGTGGDRIDALFKLVDPPWFALRKRSGLSSSEGLIVAVGDEELGEDKGGRPVVLNNEVFDKRLLTYEGEFSQLLVVMQRAGNTISTNVRNAWDGKPLRTLTIKPRVATNHTISILGDITNSELKSKMSNDDSMNGFANRFLWVHVDRSKLLPFGGAEIDFNPWAEQIKTAVNFAQNQRRVFMDRGAREMWGRAYERLATIDGGGLFGAVTSRSEAQIARLALLYALLDRSEHIQSEHLRAALALWQYCEDSARFIFDELTPEQQMTLECLHERGSQTKTDLMNFFGRNRKAADIAADLGALVRRGLVIRGRTKKGIEVYYLSKSNS